jgi:hypothetical protein
MGKSFEAAVKMVSKLMDQPQAEAGFPSGARHRLTDTVVSHHEAVVLDFMGEAHGYFA